MRKIYFITKLNKSKARDAKIEMVALVAKSTQLGLIHSKIIVDYFYPKNHPGRLIYDYLTDPKKLMPNLYCGDGCMRNTTNEIQDRNDEIIENIRKYKCHVS